MSADPQYQAALALHRFGLGPRPGTMPGSIAAVASYPRGALLAELEKPGIGQIVDSSLMSAPKAAMAAFNFREARQAAEIAKKMAEPGGNEMMANAMEAKPAEQPKPPQAANAAQAGGLEQARNTFVARQAMGRLATAEEIAALVLYLSAPESMFVTGQAVVIDGGWTI